MIKVYKGEIPTASLVEAYLPANYFDVFECTVINGKPFTPDDFQVEFWSTQPKWIEFLLKIRSILLKPFGLSVGKPDVRELAKGIRLGGKIQIGNVPPKTPEETILELRDKHLDAIISVHIKEENRGMDIKRKICVTTVVHYHNKLGVLYFFFIRPFHKVVVKSMMRSSVKALRG